MSDPIMQTPEQLADIVQHASQRLIGLGRYDLLLKSLGWLSGHRGAAHRISKESAVSSCHHF